MVGCGNPLLDISSTVTNEYLEKNGLGADNAILADETHMPIFKELQENSDVDYIAGGSVQNSLRVCQWILKKPNVCVFFGCVGVDKDAEILEKRAFDDGLKVLYEKRQDQRTGRCAVLISGKHRSLIADLAAGKAQNSKQN